MWCSAYDVNGRLLPLLHPFQLTLPFKMTGSVGGSAAGLTPVQCAKEDGYELYSWLVQAETECKLNFH